MGLQCSNFQKELLRPHSICSTTCHNSQNWGHFAVKKMQLWYTLTCITILQMKIHHCSYWLKNCCCTETNSMLFLCYCYFGVYLETILEAFGWKSSYPQSPMRWMDSDGRRGANAKKVPESRRIWPFSATFFILWGQRLSQITFLRYSPI